MPHITKTIAAFTLALLTLSVAGRCETIALKTWFPAHYGGFKNLFISELFRVGRTGSPLSLVGSLTQTGNFNVIGKVGVGTALPQAALDVTSNTGGLVIPRVHGEASVVNPQPGMLIFDTSTKTLKFRSKNKGWQQLSYRQGATITSRSGCRGSFSGTPGMSAGYGRNDTEYTTHSTPVSIYYKNYSASESSAYTTGCATQNSDYFSVQLYGRSGTPGQTPAACPRYDVCTAYNSQGSCTKWEERHWTAFGSGTAGVSASGGTTNLTCYMEW